MMRLLVAVDGSQGAAKAIDAAARLVRGLREAEVILVNVGYIPFFALAIPEATSYIDLTSVEQALERGDTISSGRRRGRLPVSTCASARYTARGSRRAPSSPPRANRALM